MQGYPHLTSPGTFEHVGRVTDWFEKIDGELRHLAIFKEGQAYEYGRGAKKGAMFSHNCQVDGHLLFEKVDQLDGKVVYYLIGGQWNNIKLPQKADILAAFLKNVVIRLDDVEIRPRPAFTQWQPGMEGLIGFIPTQWRTFYYKSRGAIDIDVDSATLANLPAAFASNSLYLPKLTDELRSMKKGVIYQVTLEENQCEYEGRNGASEVVYTKSYRVKVGKMRPDKERPDSEAKIMNIVKQIKAEDIIEKMQEE